MRPEKALIFSKKTALDHEREGSERNEYLQSEDESARGAGHQKHYESLAEIENILEENEVAYEVTHPSSYSSDEFTEDHGLYIVAGGDGTLFDSQRFIEDEPVLTVNSDPERSTGYLMEYEIDDFEHAFEGILEDRYETKEWSRAEAVFEDETDIALNEIFVGPHKTGMPASFTVEPEDEENYYQASGFIASTGAGSTGWYSPIHEEIYKEPDEFANDADELRWITWHTGDQEPPKGVIPEDDPLTIKSEMNYNGAVKFDGNRRPKEFLKGREVEIRSGKPLEVIV